MTHTHIENVEPYKTTSQSGVTLMEMIAALAIIAVIIVGSLALYNAATSSQSSTQMVQDVTTLRAATKQLFLGQGTYGAAGTDLGATLQAANRLPSTIKTNAAGALTHQLNGTVVITAAGATFTIAINNIPSDVCIPLLTNTSGWNSVQVDANAAITVFPIAPAAAANACGAGTVTLTFTSN